MGKPKSTLSHEKHERKAYTQKARIFKRVREKERCTSKFESTPSHKENECTSGKFTHGHTRKRLTYTHGRK